MKRFHLVYFWCLVSTVSLIAIGEAQASEKSELVTASAEYKMTWDLFELVKQEKQHPGCNQFQYLSFVPPHGESNGEPIHMHFRYASKPSSFATLVNMTKDKEDAAKFSPWFATYCGGGKTKCGKGE